MNKKKPDFESLKQQSLLILKLKDEKKPSYFDALVNSDLWIRYIFCCWTSKKANYGCYVFDRRDIFGEKPIIWMRCKGRAIRYFYEKLKPLDKNVTYANIRELITNEYC